MSNQQLYYYEIRRIIDGAMKTDNRISTQSQPVMVNGLVHLQVQEDGKNSLLMFRIDDLVDMSISDYEA